HFSEVEPRLATRIFTIHCSHLPSSDRPSCGLGITCTLITCPTCAAAAAPASVAAFTAATSPRKNPVTYPLPTFSQPTSERSEERRVGKECRLGMALTD